MAVSATLVRTVPFVLAVVPMSMSTVSCVPGMTWGRTGAGDFFVTDFFVFFRRFAFFFPFFAFAFFRFSFERFFEGKGF